MFFGCVSLIFSESIDELRPLEKLEQLDLSGNLIKTPDCLDVLQYLNRLLNVNLKGNPICLTSFYPTEAFRLQSRLQAVDEWYDEITVLYPHPALVKTDLVHFLNNGYLGSVKTRWRYSVIPLNKDQLLQPRKTPPPTRRVLQSPLTPWSKHHEKHLHVH